jgi:hypothetical protein
MGLGGGSRSEGDGGGGDWGREAVAVEGEVVDVVIRGCMEGRRRLRGGR